MQSSNTKAIFVRMNRWMCVVYITSELGLAMGGCTVEGEPSSRPLLSAEEASADASTGDRAQPTLGQDPSGLPQMTDSAAPAPQHNERDASVVRTPEPTSLTALDGGADGPDRATVRRVDAGLDSGSISLHVDVEGGRYALLDNAESDEATLEPVLRLSYDEVGFSVYGAYPWLFEIEDQHPDEYLPEDEPVTIRTTRPGYALTVRLQVHDSSVQLLSLALDRL